MHKLIKNLSNRKLESIDVINSVYGQASLSFPKIDVSQITDELYDANCYIKINFKNKNAFLTLKNPKEINEKKELSFKKIKIRTPLEKKMRDQGLYFIELINDDQKWEVLAQENSIIELKTHYKINYTQKVS